MEWYYHGAAQKRGIPFFQPLKLIRLNLGGIMAKAKKSQATVRWEILVNLFVLTVCLTVSLAALVAVLMM